MLKEFIEHIQKTTRPVITKVDDIWALICRLPTTIRPWRWRLTTRIRKKSLQM